MSTTDINLFTTDSLPLLAYERWNVVVGCMFVVLIVATLGGNSLTIVVFIKEKALHTPANALICNQSVADLLSALLSLAFAFTNYHPEGIILGASNKMICSASLWGFCVSVLSSVFNVFALTLERLIAVSAPFKNRSPRKTAIVIGGIIIGWIVVLVDVSVVIIAGNDWQPGRRCNPELTIQWPQSQPK
jgi:hypothetical protein